MHRASTQRRHALHKATLDRPLIAKDTTATQQQPAQGSLPGSSPIILLGSSIHGSHSRNLPGITRPEHGRCFKPKSFRLRAATPTTCDHQQRHTQDAQCDQDTCHRTLATRIGTANARKRQKHACAHINKQANIRCHRTRFSQRHQCPMRSQHTGHHPASTLNRRKQGGRPKRTRDARCARPAHPHAGLCLCGHSAAACQPPPQRAARQHLVACTSHLKLRPQS